jgi:Integral membrane protein possibly involved in chromosome condensation
MAETSLWIYFFAVGVGGIAGTLLRFGAVEFFKKYTKFPAGVLFVNVVGTFVFTLATFILADEAASFLHYTESFTDTEIEYAKCFFNIGILGSLTTFSAYSYDTFLLVEKKKYKTALLNITSNIFLCTAAAAIAVLIFMKYF